MRIFHGLKNTVGIAGRLAQYQRAHGHDARVVVYLPEKRYETHDEVIFPEEGGNILLYGWLSLRTLIRYGTRYEIFNFYYGHTFLPWGLDLPVLRLLRKKVIMIYCGTDVRQSFVERSRNPYWPRIETQLTGTAYGPERDSSKRWMMRWHALWCHRILAPRNLYASVSPFVPFGKLEKDIWVHNIVPKDKLRHRRRKSRACGDGIVLVHAPTSPLIKGTGYFRQALKALRSEGWEFEYIELTDATNDMVFEQLSDADIVLDQLLIGAFGSLAVEGMALGLPVVCYVIESVRREHYPDCPVVSANIENVTDVIRQLMGSPEWRRELGEKGRAFVSRHFDYDKVNQELLRLYDAV